MVFACKWAIGNESLCDFFVSFDEVSERMCVSHTNKSSREEDQLNFTTYQNDNVQQIEK